MYRGWTFLAYVKRPDVKNDFVIMGVQDNERTHLNAQPSSLITLRTIVQRYPAIRILRLFF